MNKHERKICAQIYAENVDQLNWYMKKRFPDLNPEDRHDIVQEAWSKLGQNIQTIGACDAAGQYHWLVAVCHNEAVSLLRKEKNSKDKEERFQKKMESKEKKTVEDEVINKMMAEDLLNKLTEEEKQVLKDYLFSKDKGKRSNADNCKLYRVRKKLKQLKKEGGWDE